MTTCLENSYSFGLPRVPFVNCCQFMYLVLSLLVLRAGYLIDLIVSVPDHCLSFYFEKILVNRSFNQICQGFSNKNELAKTTAEILFETL